MKCRFLQLPCWVSWSSKFLSMPNMKVCLVKGSALEDINPASPNTKDTTIVPSVWVYEVMQDFYHQQYAVGAPCITLHHVRMNRYTIDPGLSRGCAGVMGPKTPSTMTVHSWSPKPVCCCVLQDASSGHGIKAPGSRSLLVGVFMCSFHLPH